MKYNGHNVLSRQLGDVSVIVCIVLSVLVPITLTALFERDRAAYAVQQGDYAHADTLMQRALVDTSDDENILYDAGVVAYKAGKMDQAAAYFSSVTNSATAEAALREQAHFNRGNVHAHRSEYALAIEQYDRTLEINPENERAHHNKKIMKKLLDEQKKKEEEDKKDKKKEQESSPEKPDQQQGKQGQGEQPKNQPSDGQDNNQQRDNAADKQDTQKKEQQGSNKSNDHSQHQEKEKQNNPSIPQKDTKLDALLAQILAEQEKQDAQVNKNVIKATIKDKMAGHNDQSSW